MALDLVAGHDLLGAKTRDQIDKVARLIAKSLACRRRLLPHRGVLPGHLIKLRDADVDFFQAAGLRRRASGNAPISAEMFCTRETMPAKA